MVDLKVRSIATRARVTRLADQQANRVPRRRSSRLMSGALCEASSQAMALFGLYASWTVIIRSEGV